MSEEQIEQIEKTARSMGWSPLDEFRGDPDKWIEAEKFVERGTTQLPIMKENIDRLIAKFDKATDENKSLRSDIKAMGDYNRKSDERAFKKAEEKYEKDIVSLKKKMRKAVEDHDTAAFDEIESKMDDLDKPEPLPKEETIVPTVDPEFTVWVGENPWFNTDIRLTSYAMGVEKDLLASGTPLKGKELFDEVTKEVERVFPDKFKNPNRKKPSDVDGGEDPAPGTKGKKNYAALPADAKEACDRIVKASQSWSKPLTKEEWVQNYDWEE